MCWARGWVRVPKWREFRRRRFDGALRAGFNVRLRTLPESVCLVLLSAGHSHVVFAPADQHQARKRSAFTGFTAKDVVQGVAALFFVVSFQHITCAQPGVSEADLPRCFHVTYFALLSSPLTASSLPAGRAFRWSSSATTCCRSCRSGQLDDAAVPRDFSDLLLT
jgi:hypothetical protein